MNHDAERRQLEARVLAPLTRTSRSWYLWMFVLLVLVGAGLAAYVTQLRQGLAVTAMNDTVTWGLYISNFVFFSGIAMAGTFISGVLRLTGANWRRPLTRFAELTAVAALAMCALMPAVDMGRPDRLWHMIVYGRLESPLIWDLLVVPTYLAASIIYLYLFLIPDAALLRDRLRETASPLRRRFYAVLAMGWRGLPAQRRRLNLGGNIMMVMVIPIAVATHSVVSWIFAVTFRAGWDSTIFAPYFVAGALYSGSAMLITLMYIFRRVYHLEDYLTAKHFKYLGIILVVFGIAYIYFTFSEYLVVTYKLTSSESELISNLFFGRYAPIVWFGFFGGQIVPVVVAAIPKTRTIELLFAVSILANVGMWLARFVIVVPSLSEPLAPYSWGAYMPTLAEILITVGSFGGFALIITVFAKLFPIISVDEMFEDWEAEPALATEERRPGLQPGFAPGSISGGSR